MSTYRQAVIDSLVEQVLAEERYADATDEEVADLVIHLAPTSFRRGPWPLVERRKLVEEVTQRRGVGDRPTLYAQQMVPKIIEAYLILARTDKRRTPSKVATATRAGCSRDTISDWVERGWLTWPPA